jgi:hypothetical protein
MNNPCPTPQMSKIIEQEFSKMDFQIATKSMEECKISLVIRKIQIKITMKTGLVRQ